MAALAIALKMGIEVFVARTISISAVGPLRIGALNGETADPFADGIFNGKIVSYIMTGRTSFSAPKHHVVKSLVFPRIHALVRNVLTEYLTRVHILWVGRLVGCKRPKSFGKPNGVWRKTIGTGADAVSQILLGGIGHVEGILLAWS
ncbi:MAG: hypothetical protein DMG29_03410 [Acidobacteria bacterium]|nr:MAG: hypothetical protein DMG29_03410 [Acidobacteriota bacterium]